MTKQFIIDYFTFTKKERNGIWALLFLIMLFCIAPFFYPIFFAKNNATINPALQQQIATLQITEDSNTTGNYKNYNNENNNGGFRDYNVKHAIYDNSIKGELFNFDPNTLNQAGWEKLGVSPKAAATIINYTNKGGHFYNPEDIGKMYSLSDAMVERLLPFVQIAKKEYPKKTYNNTYSQNNTTNNNINLPIEKKTTYQDFLNSYVIDINTADTTAWKKLPGIGSKLSARIVNYKNKLGGFLNVAQVAETFGLADSTFQKIKPNLQCTPNNITTIAINSCTLEQLNIHPYITKSIANNIIQYRTQHGKYKQSSDLLKLATITPEIVAKITPYLIFD